MRPFTDHIIHNTESVRNALIRLDKLAIDAILFVADDNLKLLGSLTDGDMRRGFIKGLGFEDSILDFIQKRPAYLREGEYSLDLIELYRNKNYKILPILSGEDKIINILNYRLQSTLLPLDAVIMAGGEGKRLRPLTESTPKPLLRVGDKPIMEYNIDRLIGVGISRINISVNYLADQIIKYFGDGSEKKIQIKYVKEDKPLGTIGSILLVENFLHDDIMVMNSDLLTNIDFSDFYRAYKDSGADMAVATTSYFVDVPYAVLEVNDTNSVKSLREKPRYTYYSNAGIYILNRKLLSMIPEDTFFDVTDLMDKIIAMNNKLITYPLNCYWLDVGKHEDLIKAQQDIKHIKM